MFFVGTFELSIDTKNRLSIPYVIRSKLSPDQDGRSFYVLPGRREGTLDIYPDHAYERGKASSPSADALSDDGFEWRQFFASQTSLVDPDAQGRILIPERLLARADIDTKEKVVLIGVQDHMELWDQKKFEAFRNRLWPDYPRYLSEAARERSELSSASPETPDA
ncbi:MAG: hypothetical protein IH986_05845 [Planctomycetes bacterium]|nr:hypothetical protein [Planctomycetota bacterium]